ncbi:MAG: STAS domain-containing protein [Gemmatimonadetes bacterium]|nr:STAS domain-containing protein [Gemmatimonadota bacterium]
MNAQSIDSTYQLSVPMRLIADTRAEFRLAALESLERASQQGARDFVLDLANCLQVDASGLGILVLIEKRARERGMRTVLAQPGAELRHLLDVTRLDYLFRIVQ